MAIMAFLITLTGATALHVAAPFGAVVRAAPPRARPAVLEDALTVEHFLEDLEFLGPCRFVVMGNGAILEAIGAFEDLRLAPEKGLATVSTDTGFECHIKLAEVKSAAFATKESGDKTLHIVRLRGAEKQSLLSAILSAETPGESVEDGAIEYWAKLRERFGEEVELSFE